MDLEFALDMGKRFQCQVYHAVGIRAAELVGEFLPSVPLCSALFSFTNDGPERIDLYDSFSYEEPSFSLPIDFEMHRPYYHWPGEAKVEHLEQMTLLPPRSFTQKNILFALLTHPERPKSVRSHPLPYLFDEAQIHSEYQARVQRQGHQYWQRRSQRIWNTIGGEYPTEIASESGASARGVKDRNCFEAAHSCVWLWTQSSGHWRVAMEPTQNHGYDIKQGRNETWYATGIVGGGPPT